MWGKEGREMGSSCKIKTATLMLIFVKGVKSICFHLG